MMPFERGTIEAQFLQCALCASGVVACSGASPTAFSNPLHASETPADAGFDSVSAYVDAAAGSSAPKTAPAAMPPGVGPGDDSSVPSPDGDATAPTLMPDAADAGSSALSGHGDATDDRTLAPTSCPVTFTATSVPVDGFIFQNAVLGGDADALGDWSAANAVKMPAAGGTVGIYTVSLPLPDGLAVHFKFGLSDSSGQVSWESATQPTDRFLVVSCADGSLPSYTGQFNQIPDASSP
jgi:Starch binding domain